MIEKMSDGTEVQYEIYPLVDRFDNVLNSGAGKDFDFANPPVDPKGLSVGLIRTMMKHGGIGLAAPQCGLPYRVFVMGAPNGQGYACFNPKIVSSTGKTAFEEGCLTFKGMYLSITRPDTIEVEYQDMTGKKHTEKFGGLTARTFQHELDHLNGVVYTSLVSPYVLDKAKSKVKTNLKKLEKQRVNHAKQQIINQAIARVQEQKRIEELNKKIVSDIPDINVDLPSVTINVPNIET
jgi:peptide deformylase